MNMFWQNYENKKFLLPFFMNSFLRQIRVFANNILQNHQRILRRVFEISLIWFSFVSVLKENVTWLIIKQTHCMKSIHIRSFSGPHFLAFGSVFSPNPRKYGPETLQLRTPFTQWYKLCHSYLPLVTQSQNGTEKLHSISLKL